MWPSRRLMAVAVLAIVGAVPASCSSDQRAYDVAVEGLVGPTQLSPGPGSTLLVAQLAGPENARMGKVEAIVPGGGPVVLAEGLDKPTGVAWADGAVWIMVRRGLVRMRWDGPGSTPGPVETVLDELPYNGRSEGTLTVLPDGRIVFETSGTTRDGRSAEPGSGRLWAIDSVSLARTELAFGLKNAYAHALVGDGTLLVTDVNDASPAPEDELNVLVLDPPAAGPIDFGWPRCVDAHTGAGCDGATPPLLRLPPGATPTGVAVVGRRAYVVLHTQGRIVSIDLDDPGDAPRVELEGLTRPHTVLALDGELLVTEHDTGRILRVDV